MQLERRISRLERETKPKQKPVRIMTLADVALASINMRLGKPPLDDRYEWISPTPSLADSMNERQKGVIADATE